MPSTQPPTPSTPPHAPAVQPAGVGQLPPTAPTAWDLAALAGALRDEKGGLAFLGVAGRYFAANQRMLLFRNSLIAVCGVVLLLLGIAVCWHEAHRQTMSITAFDVPKSLEVRGITGQVVAKALFDELIRRRALVTTLDSGDLKGAWADNRADVAIPQTGFSVQSLFRYLRSMTGHEISVDGEIMLDGDDAVVKVRVAGHAPTVAKGKIAQWEGLMGDLAGGVLGIAQPAVQAAYLGLKAQTPDDLAALSKHLRQMEQASPPPSAAVLSVGYDAYGSALLRQGRTPDALLAFGEAMTLDPANGVAVVNAANVQADQRNYKEANALFTRAQSLALPDTVKVNALRRRITGATNPGDCVAAAAFIQDARASPLYTARLFVDREATFTLLCEFEEQRAVDMLAPYVALHPTDAVFTNTLG